MIDIGFPGNSTFLQILDHGGNLKVKGTFYRMSLVNHHIISVSTIVNLLRKTGERERQREIDLFLGTGVM